MTDYSNIKILVNSCYDIQKLRIQIGNRIVANFRSKLGIEPSKKADKKTGKLLKMILHEYKQITDGMVQITKNFKSGKIISDYAELLLLHQYETLLNSEKVMFSDLEKSIDRIPIWKHYLKNVKGVGRVMAGVIISQIDIEKAIYPSNIWAYIGLDVASDGKGRSRKSEHLREYAYTAKNGKIKLKKGITFNPFLKSKLIGVLAPSFLKTKKNKVPSPYVIMYDSYRSRLDNRPDLKEHSKGHKHNMAMRYIIKQFIIELHTAWRKLEKLPTALPYHEAKLNIKHKAA